MNQSIFYIFNENGLFKRPADIFYLHDSSETFKKSPRVFTTFKANYTSSRGGIFITGFSNHLQRLINSGLNFKLEFTTEFERQLYFFKETLIRLLKEFFVDNSNQSCKVRMVLSTDELQIYIENFNSHLKIAEAVTLASYQATRPYPEHKTTLTEVCLQSLNFAKTKGSSESLLLNEKNLVTETTWSNIFWVNSKQQLCTTEKNMLPGVSRALILSKFPHIFKTPTLEELLDEAIEVFITKSTIGITPVSAIDDHKFILNKSGKITDEIYQWYLENELQSFIE
ncbi:MAG: aminotransferase class IV [Proteobacteria bacterium]|nr:aminotransferase class IV [Pseudomonadota bacterium]